MIDAKRANAAAGIARIERQVHPPVRVGPCCHRHHWRRASYRLLDGGADQVINPLAGQLAAHDVWPVEHIVELIHAIDAVAVAYVEVAVGIGRAHEIALGRDGHPFAVLELDHGCAQRPAFRVPQAHRAVVAQGQQGPAVGREGKFPDAPVETYQHPLDEQRVGVPEVDAAAGAGHRDALAVRGPCARRGEAAVAGP